MTAKPMLYVTAIALTFVSFATAQETGLAVNPNPGLIILDADDEDIVPPPIGYLTPITKGDEAVLGQSIATLIEGTPLFPPVEGIPEEVWKDKACSDCHQWDQSNLCTQAEFYLKPANRVSLTKPHPYGGSFKAHLQSWALSGCQ